MRIIRFICVVVLAVLISHGVQAYFYAFFGIEDMGYLGRLIVAILICTSLWVITDPRINE